MVLWGIGGLGYVGNGEEKGNHYTVYVGFRIGTYDTPNPLIIDNPKLVPSYNGGNQYD